MVVVDGAAGNVDDPISKEPFGVDASTGTACSKATAVGARATVAGTVAVYVAIGQGEAIGTEIDTSSATTYPSRLPGRSCPPRACNVVQHRCIDQLSRSRSLTNIDTSPTTSTAA